MATIAILGRVRFSGIDSCAKLLANEFVVRATTGPLATECDIALWIADKLQFAIFAESGQKNQKQSESLRFIF